uniref:Uncharacterized protein n=1 Tax=Panagrolaimus sp. ES5 TaxID=591445 RepID=A0AC34FAB9_9BILA
MTPSWLQKSKGILDVIVNLFRQPPHPPSFSPAICGIPLSSNASTSYSEQNILNDFRIVFGVPKHRTPKLRSVTNLIKQEMMKYNPYLGERQDKSFFVQYENEKDADATIKPPSNAKIIKVKKERDSWFTSRFSENDKGK